MERIKLDHWYITGNELGISLMNFFARINMVERVDGLKFRLGVYYDSKEVQVYYFDDLENAIGFTENTISKCFYPEEIIDAYNKKYGEKTLKL